MAISLINLCSLYMNGQVVLFNSQTPIQYIPSSTLEIKEKASDINNQVEFLVIEHGSKHYYLSTKNVLINISYDDLVRQGLVDGSKIVTLGGVLYKVRLITDEEYRLYFLNEVGLNTLITPTTKDLEGTYTDEDISTSVSNNVLNWWKIATLTNTTSNNNIIIRGKDTIGRSETITKSTKNVTTGYRIFLEKYNYPAVISDENKFIGNYTTNIIRKYTITDPDNDLFKVTESIDTTTIRVLENQVSKTEFNLTLETQWSSLAIGKHTITVAVEDTFGNISKREWTFNKVDIESGTSTLLTRPKIRTNNNSFTLDPINGLVNNTFYFDAKGGDLVYSHEFNIIDNGTQQVVYNKKVASFNFQHTVPSGIFINGKDYQLKVRTYSQTEQFSAWSDSVLVKAITPADLNINTIINGRIEMQNPLFNGTCTYNQLEGDSLFSYEYILYRDGVQVDYSGELKDKLLSYQFTNLLNKTDYEIELKTRSVFGQINSIKLDFYCLYLQSRLSSVMQLTNLKSEGAIENNAYIKQIIGHPSNGDSPSFIDNEWIDLHNTVLTFDKDSPFYINGDWTMKIWARDLEDNNNMLLTLTTDIGEIKLTRYKNKFQISKYVNGIKLYQLNSIIKGDISATDELFFYVQHEESSGLMNFEVKRLSGGKTIWFTSQHIEDTRPSANNVENGLNSYDLEDGFLNNISSSLKTFIQDTTIDGQSIKLFIPSKNDLIGENCFQYFQNNAIVGSAIVGIATVGSNINNSTNIKSSHNKKYFTRTIDTVDVTKLTTVDENGLLITNYPYSSNILIRFCINVSNTLKVSKYKDKKGFYNITTLGNHLFTTQLISDLNLGDKVKEYSTRYNEIPLEFIVVNKDLNKVTLMSDMSNLIKCFDAKEQIYEFGNPSWNLSNIKQWLNNNDKLIGD